MIDNSTIDEIERLAKETVEAKQKYSASIRSDLSVVGDMWEDYQIAKREFRCAATAENVLALIKALRTSAKE